MQYAICNSSYCFTDNAEKTSTYREVATLTDPHSGCSGSIPTAELCESTEPTARVSNQGCFRSPADDDKRHHVWHYTNWKSK